MTLPVDRHEETPGALRHLMEEDGPLLIGACHDLLSAVILEQVGYRCISISGAGVAASLLGLPDIGLITHSEMLEVARRVSRRVRVPVVADIDTGFGGTANVIRTMDEFIGAGVAAVHIEDQVVAKRCGHIDGKEVVDTSVFLEKVRAAARVKQGSDVVLIARTDAIAVNGLDDAIDRANRAIEAGADVAFVEAPTSMEQVERIGQSVQGEKLFNAATGGRSPSVPVDVLGQLGFKLVSIPTVTLYPAISAMQSAARQVLLEGSDSSLEVFDYTPMDVFELVGISDWLQVGEDVEASAP